MRSLKEAKRKGASWLKTDQNDSHSTLSTLEGEEKDQDF